MILELIVIFVNTKQNNTMTDFIKITIIAFVCFCVYGYMTENNLTLVEMFTTFPNQSTDNVGQNDFVTINAQESPSVVSNPDTEQPSNTNQSETVIIRALGNVDYDDLEDASKIITEFYGFNCVIGTPEEITEDLYISGTDQIINAKSCLNKFSTRSRIVYIVDKRLWADGDYLRGFASTSGGFVIVRGEKSFLRETIIHEIGHTYGLGHCDDLSCIMAIDNDQYDSGTFCNKCKNKISHYFH